MNVRLLFLPMALLALLLAAIACGGDDDDTAGGDDAGSTATGAATATAEGGDDSGDDGGNNSGGGFGSGTGTLTIGDESWEITGIGCVFSAQAAGNPNFPFNLSGFGESSTGARSQLSADINDSSGQERLEGEGVSHHIEFDDVVDFENPSVSWSSLPGILSGGEDTVLTIDGKNIHGEGLFDDGTTDEFEMVPGTLEVVCP